MTGLERALAAFGAPCGLAGVGLAAASAHVTGPGSLETAARFLMIHAPALLVLAGLAAAGLVRPGPTRAAGLVLALGLILFCGDLSVRALAGIAPVPMAAPAGGILLMAGWALAAVAALLPRGH